MAKFVSLAALVVGGVIVADIIVHGSQTAQAAQGVASVERPALNALLGVAS
ncbi:MAG TPA: hypothetical protein VMU09_04050 [Acidimicrobiales bacterium]|nr:hypothetical protein [Acidimicrobiales bacterium]